ncbi:MAG: anhydro-N-acetylmuramic acid kinase [Phycisphaerae bacterium]|nr:anhydro-N-acetylmuramic acid kinase [Phycisphaerae bacterium]
MVRRGRIVLGLNSGTSADGVDAVACEIAGRGLKMRVRVLGHAHLAYPVELQRRIFAVMAPAETRTEELCGLETDIGRAFARTAQAIVRKLGLRRVDLIGSHGQTVCHIPPGSILRSGTAPNPVRNAHGAKARSRTSAAQASRPCRRRRDGSATGRSGRARSLPNSATQIGTMQIGTMQIGDPATIATRLRTPVVSHFRQADVAVGGQGAPLVPWTDYVLFHHPKRSRVVQNLGGIANLTWLPAGGCPDDVIAFDTGPGNMVIDALVRHFSAGRKHFDQAGRRAAKGKPRDDLVRDMSDDEFLTTLPPKSCGRERYGEPWVQSLLRRHARRRIPADDWIATATHCAAMDIAISYWMFLPATHNGAPDLTEVILCGGGAKNQTLVRLLRAHLNIAFDDVEFRTVVDHGIPLQAKEPVSFAMLAAACVDGVPANLPKVTGARRRVVLGQICDPEPRK